MIPDENELINKAYELLGELLITSENASGAAVNLLMHEFGVSEDIAGEAVAMALDRWMEIYDPE